MSTITYRNHTIDIDIDSDPYAENPRDAYSNLGIIVGSHGRYRITDEHNVDGHPIPKVDFDAFYGWDEVEAHLRAEHGAVVILPIYMYDHSGVAYSTEPFSCPWDSGQVGFIFATEATIATCGTPMDLVAEVLAGEVNEWSRWATGEYVSYEVRSPDGEVIDSLHGIDNEDYALSEAKAVVDAEVEGQARAVQAWIDLCAGAPA